MDPVMKSAANNVYGLENGSELVAEVISILGGQTNVAEIVGNGCKQQTVSYVMAKGKPFPAEWILAIESALKSKGSDIDRYRMRPDVYGVSYAA